MREIKFDFIYKGVNGFHHKQYCLDDLLEKSLAQLSDLHHQMELVASRRFTGLKDKNGKEIYEGDVVKSHFNGNSYPIVFGSCELRDDRGEFEGFFDGLIWDGMPFGRDIDGGTDHYEVIGNIYENPELNKRPAFDDSLPFCADD